MKDEELFNRFGRERISSRQIDELTGLARGLCADGVLNRAEVEFLESWLAVNAAVTGNAMIARLYSQVSDILSDGIVDEEERKELLHTLEAFSGNDTEAGEALKSTTLPLCRPAPDLRFPGQATALPERSAMGGGLRAKAPSSSVGEPAAASLARQTCW